VHTERQNNDADDRGEGEVLATAHLDFLANWARSRKTKAPWRGGRQARWSPRTRVGEEDLDVDVDALDPCCAQ
jgi:hypothetical protein